MTEKMLMMKNGMEKLKERVNGMEGESNEMQR